MIRYAVKNRIDLSRTWTFISDRISSEMARKSILANVPVIFSRGATTLMAIFLAEAKDRTIGGFVRGRKMIVYTHPEQIRETGILNAGKRIPGDSHRSI